MTGPIVLSAFVGAGASLFAIVLFNVLFGTRKRNESTVGSREDEIWE